jgi:hypothetical protein
MYIGLGAASPDRPTFVASLEKSRNAWRSWARSVQGQEVNACDNDSDTEESAQAEKRRHAADTLDRRSVLSAKRDLHRSVARSAIDLLLGSINDRLDVRPQ